MKILQINFKPLFFLLTLGFALTSCSSDNDNAPTSPEITSFQVTITASPNDGGTVLPLSGEFDKDQQIDLTATPSEGWHFKEWQGDITGTNNPIQLTVDAAKNITAVFERDLFYLADNGVTIMAPLANVGDTGVVNGITYTKRTVDQITPQNAESTCTTGITDMTQLFKDEDTFNGDISHWDVESVTNMEGMFRGASVFSSDINLWDVSSVTNMRSMFSNARMFNGNLSHWNVSNVLDMSYMFRDASYFNGDISSWNVSSVTNMAQMFYTSYIGGNSIFNQDLNNWDVSNVTDMSYMFWFAKEFNGDVSTWNVSSVTNAHYMFSSAYAFNANLSNWDVSSVTDMEGMLSDASVFNQDLTGWCVDNFSIEPNNFASGSNLTNDNKPLWGMCP
ncbi:BspA family leucine-rich repeat surface protein [Bizionia argentinensis JUB59]|uniref:BspA family leucine-rich repeat surface protein n=1 Tax=Bizionia argentinensis JUB59 TaxID=1046627 RepID=G2EGT8_9FLAO|nr:BspA family leucine-rich repeat surface protein [Bizionia argentinensis]EGV42339.1 BspA family leucine-rich repeat surface protein [Bizionia argentinensis JUB59]